MLFAKTLVRKNIASTASSESEDKDKEKAKADPKKPAGVSTSPADAASGATPSFVTATEGADTLQGAQSGTDATMVNTTANATANGATSPHPSTTTITPAEKKDEDEFSSKAQVMTLMTTDVDRVSDFAWHLFSLVDSPIEIVIGGYFLYTLLGVSAFWGLGASLREYFSLGCGV
jgi:hypothetical protein